MIYIWITHQGLVDKYELAEGEYIPGSGDDCSIQLKGSGKGGYTGTMHGSLLGMKWYGCIESTWKLNCRWTGSW